MAESDSLCIREAVTLNPSIKVSILRRLVTDNSEKVQAAAIKGIENKELQIDKLEAYEKAQEREKEMTLNGLLTEYNTFGNDCKTDGQDKSDSGDDNEEMIP